jgi:WD40 repeat protein/predicted Ser/Thr protein kinase
MTPEQHQRLMQLFDEVCDLPAAEKAARVAALSSSDPTLARDLDALLRADAGAHPLAGELEAGAYAPTGPLPSVPPPSRFVRRRLGRYTLLRVLGQGGMGVVYEAEQEMPHRKVALKVIRGELATPGLRRRFELETHILGRLTHPGISRIYEAGTEDDACFFAMELVEGQPLGEHARDRGLSDAARLELLARVCDAVQHAHLRGVIHLDLKPANILVMDDGAPKVLDFGIARIIDADGALTGATLTGQIVGTPAYMSPEQTAMSPDQLDARSDVYTLGAIGYELLAGRLPHDVRGVPIPEVIQRIRAQDPPPLSTLRGELRGDVETILAKALAREPAARYQSAAAFADDLRRHLRNEPIEARPPTAAYQLLKFAKRNRALVTALAGLLLALVAGAATAAALAVRAERARGELAARNDALAVLEARASLREDPTRAVARLLTLSPRAAWSDALAVAVDAEQLGVARDLLAGHEGEVHDVAFAGARVVTVSYDQTVRLWDLAARSARAIAVGHELHKLAISARGGIAVAGAAGTLLLVGADGTARRLGGHRGWVRAVAWSPDGATLASGGEDGALRLWSDAGAPLATLSETGGEVLSIAWSVDGRWLAAAGQGAIRLWALPAAAAPRALEAHEDEVAELAFLPDGRLLSAGRDGAVYLWDVAGDGAPRALDRKKDELKHVAVAPRGAHLAWTGRDGEVTLYEVASGAITRLALGGVARTLGFSPDGAVLAAGGDNRVVQLWAVRGGEGLRLAGHAARVRQVAFSPDGAWLASAADDGQVRLWPARTPFGATAQRVAAAAARPVIAVAGADHAIRARTLPSGAVQLLRGHEDEIYHLRLSADGRRLVSASRDKSVRVWDLAAGTARVHATSARAVRVALSGERVAAATADGTVLLWRLDDGHMTRLGTHDDRANDVAFSPDGTLVASASDDYTVRLWRAAGGEGRVLGRLAARAMVVAFAPDGRAVAAGATDGTVTVFPLAGGAPRALEPHGGEVTAIAYAPGGARIATGGGDRLVRVTSAGGTVRLAGHAGAVVDVIFSDGDEAVVSIAADGTARRFPAAGGPGRLIAIGHGPAQSAALTADGRLAFVTAEDGLRLVPVGPAPTARDVRALLAGMTRVELVNDVVAQAWTVTPSGT